MFVLGSAQADAAYFGSIMMNTGGQSQITSVDGKIVAICHREYEQETHSHNA